MTRDNGSRNEDDDEDNIYAFMGHSKLQKSTECINHVRIAKMMNDDDEDNENHMDDDEDNIYAFMGHS